ncbi:MAG: hypothetical protein GTO12_19345 [Proteobacteria bacterium]|nr:hypothetical protein [Pseudomonadota bacterium]
MSAGLSLVLVIGAASMMGLGCFGVCSPGSDAMPLDHVSCPGGNPLLVPALLVLLLILTVAGSVSVSAASVTESGYFSILFRPPRLTMPE